MKRILFVPLVTPLVLSVLTMTACSQQQVKQAEIPEARPAVVKKAPVAKRHAPVRHGKRHIVKPYVIQRRAHRPASSTQELRVIGDKIFRNEAGGVKSKLVHWNHGENFAAMGIGHFTWYPAGPRHHRFGNTFPGLLTYLEKRGQPLPAWLKRARAHGAPWNSRSQLMRAKGSRQVTELENLLYRTRHLQAEYIIKRAQRAMPRLVKKTPSRLRSRVSNNLNAVANTPGGWYALVDYVNFKGEGLNRRGGYKGQNWGLLQVLENMQPASPGPMALNNFASSAMAVLQRRVRNSPRRRNEARWLNGWSKRINTYRSPLLSQL